jgi:hypothetical protein
MSGPQVIEVVVIDSDINDTDEAKGEPDVTVNGKTLRMVQSVDGNWYGYFADKTMAQTADQTVVDATGTFGEGLDFGQFCGPTTNISGTTAVVSVTDTEGIATGGNPVTGGTNGTTAIAVCSGGFTTGDTQNVIREEKDVNAFPNSTSVGQIGVDPDVWPFIQLYTLSAGGNVVVQYNKGGGVQTTTLTFDTADQFSGVTLDRTTSANSSDSCNDYRSMVKH